ncbi:MAG: TerB family tellurite resistance protein [Pseudomonadota bacterium]
MAIWAKLVGGTAGFAIGGPLGALIGAGVGHAVDVGVEALKPEDENATRLTFTIGVIALSAKMAKADGEVTAEEVRVFRQLFTVPAEEERHVEQVFHRAHQSTAGFDAYARQIAGLFETRASILEDLLDALFAIAKADGVFHPGEDQYLADVAKIFGFGDTAYAAIRARHLGPDEADPYTILGVDHKASDAEVRTAYHRKVRDNHPDRVIAEGVPPEFIRVATERMATINTAYDDIKRQRGL